MLHHDIVNGVEWLKLQTDINLDPLIPDGIRTFAVLVFGISCSRVKNDVFN